MRRNIYLSKEQPEEIDRLIALIEKRGVPLRDDRGYASTSALIRYLVKDALEREEKKGK